MYETAVYTHVDGDVRKVSSHKTLYFTHLPRSPPWMDCHQIWNVGSSRGRNQPYDFLAINFKVIL